MRLRGLNYNLLALYVLLLGAGVKLNLDLFGKQVQPADLFFVVILAAAIMGIKKYPFRVLFGSSVLIGQSLISLLALLLISSFFSPRPLVSLVEFISILYLAALYLWMSGIHFDERHFQRLLNIWTYMSAGLCVLGLAGLVLYEMNLGNLNLVQDYPVMRSIFPFARIASTFTTMNMFATFLHVSVVFLLAFAVSGRWRLRYSISAGLIFLCLLFTASRSLLGIAITTSLALLPQRGRPYLSVFKLLSFFFAVLLAFMVLFTTIWCVFPAGVKYDRQRNAFSVSVNTLPSLYAVLNETAVEIIKQNPLIGVGPGMFDQEMVKRLDWDKAKDIYATYSDLKKDTLIDPHSTYLGWGAEAGLPFAAAMVSLFYFIGRLMWKGYRRSAGSFPGRFCYVCLCGLIGFAVNGLYIDILTMRHFWVMLGLATIAASSIDEKPVYHI